MYTFGRLWCKVGHNGANDHDVTDISPQSTANIMFLGEYNHTIDGKGRLTIPAKFRSDLAKGLVLTKGFEQNLLIYPLDEWEVFAARVKERAMTDARMRDFRRLLFAGATDLTPDRQGRVLVPQNLREFAAIGNEVVVAGVYDYLEIWSASSWEQKRSVIDNPGDASYWEDLGF